MSMKMTTADPTSLATTGPHSTNVQTFVSTSSPAVQTLTSTRLAPSISSATFVVNDEAADSSVAIGVVVGIMIVFAVGMIIIALRRAVRSTAHETSLSRVMGANENRVYSDAPRAETTYDDILSVPMSSVRLETKVHMTKIVYLE